MAKQKKEVRKAGSGKLLQLADLEDRWAENVKDVFRVQKRAILIEANATLAKQPKLFS